MQITKHTHACVELGDGDRGLLIDPGTFTPNAKDLVAKASAILITHEHFDHVDVELLDAALAERPDLQLWGPEPVTGRWSEHGDRVRAVRHGDRFTAGGLDVAVHGELHAKIHDDIPQVVNVGYLVEGAVFHPGDSYHVPDVAVSTLLVPTSGPWTKLGEAVDFVRAVKPDAIVGIHEAMLSEVGQRSVGMFLSPLMLTNVALTQLAPGETVDV